MWRWQGVSQFFWSGKTTGEFFAIIGVRYTNLNSSIDKPAQKYLAFVLFFFRPSPNIVCRFYFFLNTQQLKKYKYSISTYSLVPHRVISFHRFFFGAMVIWKGAFFLSQRTSKTTYYRNFWGFCVCGGVRWDLWGQPLFGWPLWSSCWSRDFFPYTDWSLIHASRAWDEFSGQILATSHDLGLQNAAKWRDISLVHKII